VASRSDASHRTIGVTRITLVVGVGARLVVRRLRVAVDARLGRVVGRIDVAIGADRAMMRDLPILCVIECCAQPARRSVAAGH
jgi:hypothetical protein